MSQTSKNFRGTFKMASKKARPKMLNEVMDAIANLKEPKGSTMKRIVNQLEANFMLSRKSIKMTPIIKALKHGVKMGLIKRHKGKFKLGLDPKDYAVYKTFQKRLKTRETCNRKRCKSKKGKRMSQKKHRRHRLATMDDAGSDTESLPSTAGNLNSFVTKFTSCLNVLGMQLYLRRFLFKI